MKASNSLRQKTPLAALSLCPLPQLQTGQGQSMHTVKALNRRRHLSHSSDFACWQLSLRKCDAKVLCQGCVNRVARSLWCKARFGADAGALNSYCGEYQSVNYRFDQVCTAGAAKCVTKRCLISNLLKANSWSIQSEYFFKGDVPALNQHSNWLNSLLRPELFNNILCKIKKKLDCVAQSWVSVFTRIKWIHPSKMRAKM